MKNFYEVVSCESLRNSEKIFVVVNKNKDFVLVKELSGSVLYALSIGDINLALVTTDRIKTGSEDNMYIRGIFKGANGIVNICTLSENSFSNDINLIGLIMPELDKTIQWQSGLKSNEGAINYYKNHIKGIIVSDINNDDVTLYCENDQFANNKALHNVRKGSFATDSMDCSDLSVNLDNFSLNSAQIYDLNNSFIATCKSKGSQKVDVFVCENFVSSKNGLFVIKAGTEIRDSSPQAKTHGTTEAYSLRQRYSAVKGNKRFTTTDVVLSSLNMVAVFINGYNISAPDAFSIPTELRTGLTNYEALKKMYVKDNDIVQTNSVDDSITRAKSFMDIALEGVSKELKIALSGYEKELEQLRQQNKKLSDKLNSAEDEIKVLTKSNETLIETNKSLANSLKVVEDLVDGVKSEKVLTAITKLSEYKRVS